MTWWSFVHCVLPCLSIPLVLLVLVGLFNLVDTSWVGSKNPNAPTTNNHPDVDTVSNSSEDSRYEYTLKDQSEDAYYAWIEEQNKRERDDLKYSGPVDMSRLSNDEKRWVETMRSRGASERWLNEKLDKS
jgi:hypothetical protein